MNKHKGKLVIHFFLLFFILIWFGYVCLSVNEVAGEVSEAEAKSAIKAADNDVLVCYSAVADASKAGANVTALLITLNEAGGLLSKAKLAYNNSNFTSAFNFAVQSQDKLKGFVGEAEGLRESAMQANYEDFMFNVVGSGVGAVAVLVGGYIVWVILKRREKPRGRGR